MLAPQDNGDICQWLPYAEELATRYRVALFDWKEPRSEVLALAAATLRDAGARKVVLGGASFGGELTLPGFDGRPGIRKWRGPLLQISSVDRFLARVLS